MAYENNLTCFNIVNVENSPITQVIDEIQKQRQSDEQTQVLYNESDDGDSVNSTTIGQFVEKNIGLYMKTGHCYSDIKSFIS
jgi:hypothetical protein